MSYHWNEFFWPLTVTDNDAVRPVTVGLAKFTQAAEAGANWQLSAAGTLIVVGPLIALYAFSMTVIDRVAGRPRPKGRRCLLPHLFCRYRIGGFVAEEVCPSASLLGSPGEAVLQSE
ncbi:MAG: hypothetical protein IMX03_05225 [Brockia lithotrophica]|nr:hypothetical protein [Brockia lithotrophica]